jgi:hypothetical protein
VLQTGIVHGVPDAAQRSAGSVAFACWVDGRNGSMWCYHSEVLLHKGTSGISMGG